MFWVLWITMAVVTGVIAESKGKSGCGYALFGFLLWPVALVMVLIAKPSTETLDKQAIEAGGRKCPRCAEIVKRDAKVCRFCQAELEPLTGADDGTGPSGSVYRQFISNP